jgi:hypothetical protein
MKVHENHLVSLAVLLVHSDALFAVGG